MEEGIEQFYCEAEPRQNKSGVSKSLTVYHRENVLRACFAHTGLSDASLYV